MNRKTLWNLFLYGFFGMLSVLLNIFVYWLVTRLFSVEVVPATLIAWIIAVLFAYYTNRKFVFHSKVSALLAIIFEALYFFACRLATGVIDVAVMYIFVDLLNFDDVIIKTLSNIIVIILNYIASKLFIFKGEDS